MAGQEDEHHMEVGSAKDVLSIARSGMAVSMVKLDVAANNLANSQTHRRTSETAFRPSTPVVVSLPGGGAQIAGIVPGGSDEGVVFADPLSALADAKGEVRGSGVDVASSMVEMMVATRSFEANATVVAAAAANYQSIMDLMKPGANGPLLG